MRIGNNSSISEEILRQYLEQANALIKTISDYHRKKDSMSCPKEFISACHEQYKIFHGGVWEIVGKIDINRPIVYDTVYFIQNLDLVVSYISKARKLLLEQLNKVVQEKNNHSSNQYQQILSTLNSLKIETQALKLSHEDGISIFVVPFLKQLDNDTKKLGKKVGEYKRHLNSYKRKHTTHMKSDADEIKSLCVNLRDNLVIDPPSKTCSRKRQTRLKIRKQRACYKIAKKNIEVRGRWLRVPYLTWDTYALITKRSLDDELRTIKRAHARFKLQLARDSSSGGVLNNNARPTY